LNAPEARMAAPTKVELRERLVAPRVFAPAASVARDCEASRAPSTDLEKLTIIIDTRPRDA
jgi:hypothetical protein